MKRTVFSFAALGLLATLATTSVQAQGLSFGVGGGLLLPLSDFKDIAKTGWNGMASVGYAPGASPLSFRGDFMYAQNNLKNGVDGKTKLAGGIGSVVYTFQGGGSVTPYVLGGAGVFNAKVEATGFGSSSETKFTWGGGAGIKFKAGSDASIFAEGRYMNVSTSGGSTKFIPITVGVSFGTK